MPKAIDLTGKEFWNFTVIGRGDDYIRKNGKKVIRWKCRCKCGNIRNISATQLRSGKWKSCGCMHDYYARINNTHHGDTHKRLHHIWLGMKARCNNEKDYHYKWYGGRGISVCEEWNNDYTAFRKWALSNGYSDKLTIDRIDTNGNYEPSNCRWVDMKTQNNNRRNNTMLSAFGKTMTLQEWSDEVGIKAKTIRGRISRGYNIERAISAPVKTNQKLAAYRDRRCVL